MRLAEPGKSGSGKGRQEGRALDPEAVTVAVTAQEFVAQRRLWNPSQRVGGLRVVTHHHCCRVEAQVSPHPAAAESRALQDHRRSNGSGGEDHDWCIDNQPAPGGARARVAHDCRHALHWRHGSLCGTLENFHSVHRCPGVQPRSPGERARQEGQQRALLGVVAASQRAGTGPHAIPRVDAGRTGAPAQGLRTGEDRAVGR